MKGNFPRTGENIFEEQNMFLRDGVRTLLHKHKFCSSNFAFDEQLSFVQVTSQIRKCDFYCLTYSLNITAS